MKIRRSLAAAAASAVAAVALSIAAPLAASAHVRVNPDQATPGSYAVLTFRVPTESATAGTVKLEVDFPTDTPFTSVSYQPVAGWSAQVTTSTLPKPVKISGATVTEAPSKIVWTADPGVQVKPGQFQEFAISAGIVPDTGKMLMPATQTYSDGTVVKWDQKTPASGQEPEHPAPTLYINDAPPSDGTPTIVSSSAAPVASPAATSTDAAAIGIAIGGLVLGAIALVVAVLGLVRRPRSAVTGAGPGSTGAARSKQPGGGSSAGAGTSGTGTGGD
ncbi:YcnI family protein [Humibacter albus]|uniref:YcnI family copper-binding membrane protein n=1 Tax=Humibacter albus TaxID=427754 RepID=UPI0003B64E81|nr:YcnI family protein [Humibacter albus]